jgi:hypothetical protein
MSEAEKLSKVIKKEANRLLTEIELFKLLRQFGDVDLGGSYSYDLMVDRDLDFGLAVGEVSPELREGLAKKFTGKPWVYKFSLVDRVNFKPHTNPGAPRGLFLGLIIFFEGEYWNIDIWIMVAKHVGKDALAKRMERVTKKQKEIMLQIKYELLISDKKQKGSSAEIYKAVMDKGVESTVDYLKQAST